VSCSVTTRFHFSTMTAFISSTLLNGRAKYGIAYGSSKCVSDVKNVGMKSNHWGGARGERSLQPTAFFTSALILASSVAVNFFNANATGHRTPSSRFAASLKPSVAYLVLNF